MTPVRKVAVGLVFLTVSLLLVAELIGIVPNEQRGYVEGRRILGESLAVQLSTALAAGDTDLVHLTLNTLVERDPDVISSSVVTQDGRAVLTAGPHASQWGRGDSGRSTSSQVLVPIFAGERRWGAVQIVFSDLPVSAIPYSAGVPLLPLILFITIVGFAAFLWFIC